MDRRLTESEYAAMLPLLMEASVKDLNERLRGVLPEGMHFAYDAEQPS